MRARNRITLILSIFILSIFLLGATSGISLADDWPMWGHDVGRSMATADSLNANLQLQWARVLPPAQPAWPATQHQLQFDVCYEPIATGGLLFLPSNVSDSVTAYDTKSGEEKWRFFAEGPVRFAPAASEGKIYFGSDDGYLYCLDAAKGTLLWKFRAGPSDKKIIGNERLVSAWPLRGAPVLADGRIYFSASIWPFLGIFHYALDAQTGEVLWCNSGDGSRWQLNPHPGAEAFSSLASQGYLAIAGERLVLPGGRSTPGVINRATGEFEHFNWMKSGGGGPVQALGEHYFNGGMMFNLADGKEIAKMECTVLTPQAIFSARPGKTTDTTVLLSLSPNPKTEITETKDKRGKTVKGKKSTFHTRFETLLPNVPPRLFLKAGSQFYFGGKDRIACAEVSPEGQGKVLWTKKIHGDPGAMIAADERLFVLTLKGAVLCFGAQETTATTFALAPKETKDIPALWAEGFKNDLIKNAPSEGYCLILGVGEGRMAKGAYLASKRPVLVLEPDASKVEIFRRKWTKEGIYGKRLSILTGDITSVDLPPYLASSIYSEDIKAAQFQSEQFLEKAFETLRPYGGTLRFFAASEEGGSSMAAPPDAVTLTPEEVKLLKEKVEAKALAQCKFSQSAHTVQIERSGPLPGSGDWNSQYANAANSLVSTDTLIQAPFGVLWFGGLSNEKILPRHGHGPSPQVAAGRLFIEGPDILRATDIYTGRLLWEKSLPDIGAYYNVTDHFAGAGEIGSNYVSLADGVYVAYATEILRLDPATGKTEKTFTYAEKKGTPLYWGTLLVSGDLLLAPASPTDIVNVAEANAPVKKKKGAPASPKKKNAPRKPGSVKPNARYASSSALLVAMNRHSGELLWTRRAKYGFRHNAIIAAAGKIFCIDSLPKGDLEFMKRRGKEFTGAPTLYALDAKSGEVLWKTEENVFGTWLSFSEEHGVLIQGTSTYRDRAADEAAQGIAAFQGDSGKVIWKDLKRKYSGPVILHHDRIITNGSNGEAYELLTGKSTGWTWDRQYGCNTAIASEHLMTFRSGAAGYYDLAGDSGTGNIGGFKSSCTANLIPAGGLLNAPDYTHTCVCSYQNQTSLALIHAPEEEMWTYGGTPRQGAFGVNFGAPGNRRAPNGTLWMDYPNVGNDPKTTSGLTLTTTPTKPTLFRRHASKMQSGDLKWVSASGVRGLRKISVGLNSKTAKPSLYTVRLVFAEPKISAIKPAAFDLTLQGKKVLSDFSVLGEAGGPDREIIKEFKNIQIDKNLEIVFGAKQGEENGTILCGIEILAE